MRQVELADIVAVDPYRAELHRVHGADQPGQCRLAGAAAADNAEHRSRRYGQRYIVEGRRGALAVAERHPLELDLPRDLRPQAAHIWIPLRRAVHDLAEHSYRKPGLLIALHQPDDLGERGGDAA